MSEHCDCCGIKTDERSLESVGNYFVCRNCYSNFDSDSDLIRKIQESDEKSKMYSTMLRNAILTAHFDFINQEKLYEN